MRHLLGYPIIKVKAATTAAAEAFVAAGSDAVHTDSETLPGYSWWPRQRSIVALPVLAHVAVLLHWLYQVLQKATLDANKSKGKALMKPAKYVNCTCELSNLRCTKLLPYTADKQARCPGEIPGVNFLVILVQKKQLCIV